MTYKELVSTLCFNEGGKSEIKRCDMQQAVNKLGLEVYRDLMVSPPTAGTTLRIVWDAGKREYQKLRAAKKKAGR
jgi:hypothetical protein